MINKTSYLYTLVDKIPVPCPDIEYWAQWIENPDNQKVVRTKINKDAFVSTVFLGIDHALNRTTPILFETMVFGGEHNSYCKRYCTWTEAELGHWEVVFSIFEEDSEFLDFVKEEIEPYTQEMAHIDDELIEGVHIDEV